ncbi:unnamed protein product [Vicia faba]|uniref:Uncharacterized protein n=1 Tax=Vicia faba TaxID=3906 RepID=A0AAV0ZW24_VICFA|nr:unnamed protein product [Vicia faba]
MKQCIFLIGLCDCSSPFTDKLMLVSFSFFPYRRDLWQIGATVVLDSASSQHKHNLESPSESESLANFRQFLFVHSKSNKKDLNTKLLQIKIKWRIWSVRPRIHGVVVH